MRLAPYRTLVLLTWGQHSWRDQLGTRVCIHTGPASRFLKLSSARLREHLNWLSTSGLIRQLSLSYGEASFSIPSEVVNQPDEAGDSMSPVDSIPTEGYAPTLCCFPETIAEENPKHGR